MVVLVLTACPAGLRGHLTRWLLEISPGVFVGTPTARVRELMWLRVNEYLKGGRALMVYRVRGEQKLDFRVAGHDWEPVDFDGIHLIRRPHQTSGALPTRPTGWSKASRYRRRR